MHEPRQVPYRLLAGVFACVGVLSILLPNLHAGIEAFRQGWALQNRGLSEGAGVLEHGAALVLVLGRAALVTFATGLHDHPVLTVIVGLGALLVSLVLYIEYRNRGGEAGQRGHKL
ncbi:MAG: hypothetical protein ABEI31_03395 [Halodesulfurarchaeum sp.]